MKIYRGCTYFEAESFSRLKSSWGWKCLPTVWGWNCLGAENVSKLFRAATVLGLKVSPNCSRLKVSRGWKFLEAESFPGPQVSQGWNCRNWKCLRAESVFHPQGCKCLAAENVWAANFSQLKLSQGWKCLLGRGRCIWNSYLAWPWNLRKIILGKDRTAT